MHPERYPLVEAMARDLGVTLDKPAAAVPMARALAEAAAWVGCETVYPERTSPAHLAQPLAAALKAEGVS